MKRLVFIALLGFLGWVFPNSDGIGQPMVSLDFACSTTNIPQYLVDIILKKASQKLSIPYQDLCQDYHNGKCSIETISQKQYKVSAGGGMTIIILDDAL